MVRRGWQGRRDTWLGEIRRRAVREEAGLRQRNEADFEAHVRHIRRASACVFYRELLYIGYEERHTSAT